MGFDCEGRGSLLIPYFCSATQSEGAWKNGLCVRVGVNVYRLRVGSNPPTHPPRAELSTGGLREHLLGLAVTVRGFDIDQSLGSEFAQGLGPGLATRLVKGAPLLHNPLTILVHAVPDENDIQNEQAGCYQH